MLATTQEQFPKQVSGVVRRIAFRNPDTGFFVAVVQPKQGDPARVVGSAIDMREGQHVVADGAWETGNYGLQFRATACRVLPPVTPEGIKTYLGSGLVPGIGKALAGRLVARFGEQTLAVIENEPQRLREVAGIGAGRAERICAAWKEQKAVQDIMVFLHSYDISTALATRILRTYGTDAVAQIRDDPYRLAFDVRGVGFLSADRIARSVGIPADSPRRLRAAVHHVLTEATGQGHCGLPTDEALRRAGELVQLPAAALSEAADMLVGEGQAIVDSIDSESALFPPAVYHSERIAGQRLRELAARAPAWAPKDAPAAVAAAEAALGVDFAAEQRAALATLLGARVAVLTGGPGVGKTTCMRALLWVLRQQQKLTVALCAPTGKAAKRLAEACGDEGASTVHRLLGASTTGYARNETNPLDADVVVVDESSMIDVYLASALLRALPAHASLLLVGDVDQLPSVGPGAVLADAIASGAVPVVRLTQVHRQAAGSAIIQAAHAINRGAMPALASPGKSDLLFLPAETPTEILAAIDETMTARLPLLGYAVTDAQILAPMIRGEVGVAALNARMQALLNPAPAASLTRFGRSFGIGDRVIQTSNDYERGGFNGDIGTVVAVDPEGPAIEVTLDDGRNLRAAGLQIEDLQHAWALTVHKFQGSEAPVVVIPVTTQHFVMLKRNLLYTAITRARRLVVLIGQRRALQIAVRTADAGKRYTRLRAWMTA